jgi:RNA polymerase sigma-70 factor (ECF subfamily)
LAAEKTFLTGTALAFGLCTKARHSTHPGQTAMSLAESSSPQKPLEYHRKKGSFMIAIASQNPLSSFRVESASDRSAATLQSNTALDDFVSRLRNHDSQAFEDLVNRYTARLYTAAKRMLKNADDAADAVQDAFVMAYLSIHKFRGRSSIFTWLYRILVNNCLMQIRSGFRRRQVAIDSAALDAGCSRNAPAMSDSEESEAERFSDELKALVLECVYELPSDHRQIILLRDYQGLSTNKTAAMLGLSLSATKTRLHRARQALRAIVELSLPGVDSSRIVA